jgi:hypothetical protein
MIFDNVRVLFYVRGSQDFMKIQLNLNKLPEWCEGNSLFLNGVEFETITFSRTRYLVKFAHTLAETVLDRVISRSDLRVTMDKKMNFSEHVDVMIGKDLEMLVFIRRLSYETILFQFFEGNSIS